MEDFQKMEFNPLKKKALKRFGRKKVFFGKTKDKVVINICKDIDNIIKNNSYNIDNDIVLLGFRMSDNRSEPIYRELVEKYDSKIECMCLYVAIAFYLSLGNVPTFEDIKKYIVYDAVYGSGEIFRNMGYVGV